MKTRILIFSLLTTAILSSCQKEKIELVVNNNCSELLFFETRADFEKSVNIVMKMTKTERLKWEKERGFKSYGLEAERFYNTIDTKSFKSIQEILQFVKRHENYLELIDDDMGEYELDIRYGKKAERYLMNLDQMYQIGDSVFKVLAGYTVVAHSKDSYLFQKVGNSVDFYRNQKEFQIISTQTSDATRLKSVTSNCGTAGTWRSTIGNERLKVDIGMSGSGGTVTCSFSVKPYMQVLGIWFRCYRYISANIELNYRYLNDVAPGGAGFVNSSLSYSNNYIYDNVIEESRTTSTTINQSAEGDEPYFSSYNVWADSYEVVPITQQCN